MAAQPTSQQLIEGQKQDWNRVAGGWEKWDRLFEEQMAFVNHRLVADARLRAGLNVLDLGSGTGYPALLDAQVVGPAGSVTGMDLAEQMLAAAERKAQRLGLANVSFKTGDVTSLPFESNSFDAVTSRFCLMFLPEIPKAAAEIARVLKPGGTFIFIDSLQMGDRPGWDGLLESFPVRFHEPYFRHYAIDDLDELFATAGLPARSQSLAFLAKVMVRTRM